MSEKSVAQINKALGAVFPPEAIKQRPGGKGKLLDYVQGHTVIHRLNDATGNVWDFRVLQQSTSGDLLTVLVELEIPGLGKRQHMGVQRVAPGSGEDLYKGAITDGLKKAATLFGVGLELYGEDYEAQDEPPAPPPTPIKVEDWPDDRLLGAMGQERGEAQYQRLLVVYIGRATDRETLLRRTADALKAGPQTDAFKGLASEVATNRGDALGLPRKGAKPQPAEDITEVVGEPEGNNARLVALVWSTARERGVSEEAVLTFATNMYRGGDLTKLSNGQLDSIVTAMRTGILKATG